MPVVNFNLGMAHGVPVSVRSSASCDHHFLLHPALSWRPLRATRPITALKPWPITADEYRSLPTAARVNECSLRPLGLHRPGEARGAQETMRADRARKLRGDGISAPNEIAFD